MEEVMEEIHNHCCTKCDTTFEQTPITLDNDISTVPSIYFDSTLYSALHGNIDRTRNKVFSELTLSKALIKHQQQARPLSNHPSRLIPLRTSLTPPHSDYASGFVNRI